MYLHILDLNYGDKKIKSVAKQNPTPKQTSKKYQICEICAIY